MPPRERPSAGGPPRRRRGPGADRFRPRKYTKINSDDIDYKDLMLLRRFISDRGKVRSRRVTGLSRKHQVELALAVQPRAGDWRCCPTSATAEALPVAQAILLKDVEDLGTAGEAVEVSPGYLRNFLIPRKLAQPATTGALEAAQRQRAAAEKAAQDAAERPEETAALLHKTVLTIQHRAGEDGTPLRLRHQRRDRRGDRRRPRPSHRPQARSALDEPIREVGTFMVEVEIAPAATTPRSRRSSPRPSSRNRRRFQQVLPKEQELPAACAVL